MHPVKTLRLRTILLREGEITLLRRVHECPSCRASHAPLDSELGAQPRQRIAIGVRELVCWHAAQNSFEDTAKTLKHCHSLTLSQSEVARIAHEDGSRIAAAQAERDERWTEPVTAETPVFPPEIRTENLVLEIDATAVLTRAGEEHKMVTCGRAFDASARTDNGSGRPMLLESRYAAGAASLGDFEAAFLALANRMGARGASRLAVVADGAEPLWNFICRLMPHATQIQDIWHVFEHLHDLSRTLFGEASEQAAERWCGLLRESRIDVLLEELRLLLKRHRGTKRKCLADKLRYLENGRHRMDYARYRAEGWPIGSGAIEGTCKHLVKERFALTGARWRRDQIEDVLALRLAQFNDEWQTHWPKAA